MSSSRIQFYDQVYYSDKESDEGQKKSEEAEEEEIKDFNRSKLSKLAIQVIDCICGPVKVIDINDLSDRLQVKKRRLYDVVNVLEGIGYVEKCGKNKVRWLGTSTNESMEKELAKLNIEINKLTSLEKSFDIYIENLMRLMSEEFIDNHDLNFITIDDCHNIITNTHGKCLVLYDGTEDEVVDTSFSPRTDEGEIIIEPFMNDLGGLHYFQLEGENSLPFPQSSQPVFFQKPNTVTRNPAKLLRKEYERPTKLGKNGSQESEEIQKQAKPERRFNIREKTSKLKSEKVDEVLIKESSMPEKINEGNGIKAKRSLKKAGQSGQKKDSGESKSQVRKGKVDEPK